MSNRQQGKCFRTSHQSVKYPVSKPKLSFLSKVRSIVHRVLDNGSNDNNNEKEKNNLTSHGTILNDRHNNKRTSSVSLPGGFFNPDDSTPRIKIDNIKKRNGNTTLDDLKTFQESISIIENDEADDTYEANVSNAKLAKFFSEKGDQPLTDMEKEGVLSLLKKTNTLGFERSLSHRESDSMNTSINLKSLEDFESSRILKASNTSTRIASFRPPTFIPKFDDTMASNNTTNSSFRSTASRRRVFDYSSMPSPYKTTVYKYSAIGSRRNTAKPSSEMGSLRNSSITKPTSSSSHKKMTNTASALLSLLDNQPILEGTSSKLANPYSSHVDQLNHERNANPNVKNSVVQEPVLQYDQVEQEGTIDESKSKKRASYNSLKSNDSTSQTVTFNKYKPARSSSLRSNVMTADISPEKKTEVIKTSFETAPFNSQPQIPTNNSNDIGVEITAPVKSFSFGKTNVSEKPKISSLSFADRNLDKPLSIVDNAKTCNKNSIPKIDDVKPISSSFPFSKPFEEKKTAETSTGLIHSSSNVNQNITNSMEDEYTFDFGNPIASNLDPSSINENKVKEFESMFVF